MLLSDPEGLGTFETQSKTCKFKTLISHVTTVTSLLSSHFPQENKESLPATKVCWRSVDKVTSQNTPRSWSKRNKTPPSGLSEQVNSQMHD